MPRSDRQDDSLVLLAALLYDLIGCVTGDAQERSVLLDHLEHFVAAARAEMEVDADG